ncbi:MAG: hypothetical protein ACRDKI_00785 [Solirubrobacterales bacterium]
MNITPVELGIAVLALIVLFGPKKLPSFKKAPNKNMVDLASLAPSQPAAARAPSPLSTSVAPPQHMFSQPQQQTMTVQAYAQPQPQAATVPPQPEVQPRAYAPIAQQPAQPADQPQQYAALPTHPGTQEPQYALVGTSQPLKLPEQI